ncbi:MAG: alpha-N-arabinofuranosidase [Chloroflexi bacterium]|nr:alpha-N-arabinofuranosidase [Chloroflexota bacterium]
MGRAIYGGIYEPGSPLADERGLRRDVLDALRELQPPVIRYPGGNFLSGYHWLDGVGPRAQRPRRRELAWQSVETNQFGANEFIAFCRALGTQPMLGVNLGTGTIEEAAALVEYCNAPTGTHYADLRAAHGHPEPHGVRYWCLGNEMDGPWQIGHLEMDEYARKAREAAKLMRWQDPAIQLIVCGSSNSQMPTYPEWDRVALETCWELVDYLSMHYYAGNRDGDTASYLALAAQFEAHVDTLAGTLRYVQAKRRSKHRVYLAWDEWNVWYKARTMQGGWTEAPHLIEEIYNLEDALVVAQWLSVFLRRCNVLKIACLAQLVNIIAPILTTPSGLLRQTIFYPLQLFRRYASGMALDALVRAPSYETAQFGAMPLLDVSASYNAETRTSAVFIVNRSQRETLPIEVNWQSADRSGAPASIETVIQLAGHDPKAANIFDQPDTIRPVRLDPLPVTDGTATLALPPLSFTVLASQKP